jgi:hypothetical protein
MERKMKKEIKNYQNCVCQFYYKTNVLVETPRKPPWLTRLREHSLNTSGVG